MTGDLDTGLGALADGIDFSSLEGGDRELPERAWHVLVVDDRQELRDSLRLLMEAEGFRVTCAGGGLEALQVLDAADPAVDLMLLDLVMPDMPGLEVLDAVRARDVDTAVVVVSGEPSFDHVQRALTRGAADFIRKPYEPEELLSAVRRAADRLRLERSHSAMEEKVRRSELLHRFIVNSAPDLVYILDRDGRFAFLNERVEALLGFSRSELLGRPYSALIHEDDVEPSRFVFNERRTGERASRNVELRLRSRRAQPGGPAEAAHIWVELTSMGVYTDSSDRRPGTFLGTFGIARDITERKRAQELINFQAYHDLLTHLPNRALLKDRLEITLAQARRGRRKLAVMFLDLDRFKLVNDTLGHTMGDRLLKAVASRLQGCVRRGDTLSRFGGDEFCLLLPEVRSNEDVAGIAQKILDRLTVPFLIDEHELFVGASIGIAMYPDAGESVEALIQNSDIAMYHVKSRGKNGYQFFTRKMNEKFSSQLSMERELRNAMLNDDLLPHFQPLINVETGQVVGVEALARWMHARRGVIQPAEFIPLAEETGLIVQVDQIIQRKACEQVARWREAGHADLMLSMNVTASQMETTDFVDQFLGMLEETGLGTRNVKLEITESDIMREMDAIVPKLRKLGARGITIGIDDFGTGYSSLSYLKHFPVNTLKIDRSFVSDIRGDGDESSIVNAIIHMAKGLGLDIIAEGVENRSQLSYLHRQGCNQVQGFMFSEPVDGKALATMLAGQDDDGDRRSGGAANSI